MPLIPFIDRSDYLTTAAALSRVYRDRAEQAFDEGDTVVWERMTDAADRLAALPPSQIEPLF